MQIEKIKNQILLCLIKLVGEKDHHFFKWLYEKYEEDGEGKDKYVALLDILKERLEYVKACCVS